MLKRLRDRGRCILLTPTLVHNFTANIRMYVRLLYHDGQLLTYLRPPDLVQPYQIFSCTTSPFIPFWKYLFGQSSIATRSPMGVVPSRSAMTTMLFGLSTRSSLTNYAIQVVACNVHGT